MRILILPDQLTWALGHVASALTKYIPEHYFDKLRLPRRLTSRRTAKYDAVYVMYPSHIEIFHDFSSKFIGGIHSFRELGVENPNTDHVSDEAHERIKKYLAINVPCYSLHKFLLSEGVDSYYTPYGVDTDIFYPTEKQKRPKLVFGFAGHPDRHGTTKGFHDYIKPAFERVPEVEIKFALGIDRILDQNEMREFYNSIDMLVCMSRTETGPLPVLEAMACGVPVISTAVGLVPEVVTHMHNGIIIERDVDILAQWLRSLASYRSLVDSLSLNAIESIQKWSWPNVVDKWKIFLESQNK